MSALVHWVKWPKPAPVMPAPPYEYWIQSQRLHFGFISLQTGPRKAAEVDSSSWAPAIHEGDQDGVWPHRVGLDQS